MSWRGREPSVRAAAWRRVGASRESLRERVLARDVELWPALAILAVYAVMYLQFAAQLVAFPFDLDQGEGYDAWSAWLINLGQVPYTSNAEFPYFSSNYPPLWSYVVSIPMAWLGPGLASARLISTLAGVATALVLGVAARRLSGRPMAGLLAAGFFLASPYVFHTTPLARVNSLALLAAVAGLALIERPTRRDVALGCLALLAALFTKPTAVDAALAGFLALVLRDPRRGLVAAALTATAGLIGLGALIALTRGAFWLNVVVGNANPFALEQLAAYLANFSLLHCVLLVMATAECVWLIRRGEWSPWPLYLVASAIASLGVAKWGAGESYFLGAIAATCVLAAAWLARFLDSLPVLRLRMAIGVALVIQAALLSHAASGALLPWLDDRGPQGPLLGHAPGPSDLAAARSIADEVRRAPGPALAEDPSFAVAAGKPLIGNATHLRNLYLAGKWDPAPMVNELRTHKYAIVILDAELYPEPVLSAIGQFYFLDRSVHVNGATYHVFLPGS